MESRCVGGAFALVLTIVCGQDTYQSVPYSYYNQNLSTDGQELQYNPPEAYYPISSRQGTIGLLPLGIAAAVGVGAAVVGGALALQAANARTTLTNNVATATTAAENINNIINAQSPILTSIVMTQAPTTARLTSVCAAAAAIAQLPAAGATAIAQGMDVAAIIDALEINMCTI